MTEKQEKILHAALTLFALEGYAATSTKKVAKAAGVSEGLIYRHFTNKKGLLNAILDNSKQAAKELMTDIVMTADPKELLRKALEMPFLMNEAQKEIWKLVYALKWQVNYYDSTYQEPVRIALNNAFQKLGYQNPEAEVDLFFMLLDGAATNFILHPPKDKDQVLVALKAKYKL